MLSLLVVCCRRHKQASKLGFPLKMLAAAQAPEARQPEAAKEIRLCTQSSDPDLAPWLLWALGGAPNVAVAELLLPRIPTGLLVMPNLAHLVLRAHVIDPADIQSALQAAPNLETLLLGRDWCIDEPPQDETIFEWDFSATSRLRHLFLEHIRPLSLTVPEGCTVSLRGELPDLNAMFGRPKWKLHGGRLHILEAWGRCRSGLAAKYPHVTANLAGDIAPAVYETLTIAMCAPCGSHLGHAGGQGLLTEIVDADIASTGVSSTENPRDNCCVRMPQ